MEPLFDGVFKRAESGNFGGLAINFEAGGLVDTTCMNKLPERYAATWLSGCGSKVDRWQWLRKKGEAEKLLS